MNDKFIGKAKRVLAGFVAAAAAITMLPAIPANAEDSERYPYTLFAGSSAEGAITTTASNFGVNGNVATNGTISAAGNMNINGTKTENAGLDMIYILDKIDSEYFSGNDVEEHTEDYVLDELNINISEPTEVLGEAELTGNININTALKAFKDVTLNGEVKNTDDSVIYSKYGDIIIDSTNVNLNGLVYAPFGSVEVKAMNLNLNNVVIIADSIVFDCPNVNANYSTNAADFVGTVSEPLNIPKDEWQYMKDENGNGLPDFFENFENWSKLADSDGDGLPDSIEEYLGSDPNNIDTDEDGLNDFYEVFGTFTDPTKADTDDNGINDGDEDFDEDGLTNLEEFDNETNPYIADTDCDGLSDGDEVNTYGTDPLVADTDGDGLDDGDEILLGTNPLVQDTDGDGIIDSKEKFQQTFTHKVKNDDCAVTEVIVDMECTGNINKTTAIESVMNTDILCTDVVGLVGEPFEIETNSEFDKATLTFKIDKDMLGEIPFDNLLFLWYNEEDNEFVELETTLDEANSTASITTTHFSKYMVVDKYNWFAAWAVEFDYNPTGGAPGAPSIPVKYNTVLAIDCSGSMDWNDHISIKSGINSAYDAQHPYTCNRITAAEGFIRYMHSIDETAIVFFTNGAKVAASMTSDTESLKLALQKIRDSGGTSFSAALNASIAQLDTASKISYGANKNRIILLSDGDDGDYASTRNAAVKACKDKYIEVYTVGFGSANDRILQQIADETGGKYYRAMKAADIVDIFAEIGYIGDFDMTDTDKDGLPDAVEAAGIRLQNGQILMDVNSDGIIFTDPTKCDTDGDGLMDGEEIDPTPYLHITPSFVADSTFCGPIPQERSYYFKAKSNPRKKDSDDDGYADGPIDVFGTGKYNDPRPMHCDVFSYKLKDSETYVKVDGKYGGAQSWIRDTDYPNRDILADGGCAIVVACDFMIYLERANSECADSKYAGLTGLPDINNITKKQYVELFYNIGSNYVKPINFLEAKETLEESIKSGGGGYQTLQLYTLLNCVTGSTYTWGVMPWDYPKYINNACSAIDVQQIDLTVLSLTSDALSKNELWGGIISGDFNRALQNQKIKPMIQNQLIKNIKNSLSNNCPVTLCYGLNSKYTFYEDTKFTSPYKESMKAPHYVNMTEYVIDTIANEEYITISSWGERFYIDPKQIFEGHGIGGSLFFYET